MSRLLLTLVIAICSVACASAQGSVTIERPVGAPQVAYAPEPPVALPAGNAASRRATEEVIGAIVREFCLPALESGGRDAELAARVAGMSVVNPWREHLGGSFHPENAWSRADTPRLFFWTQASELQGLRECWVMAFDGRLSVLSASAIDEVEGYAGWKVFGRPKYPPAPRSALSEKGVIDRHWAERDFSASFSLDRSNPAATGFQVNIVAKPQPPRPDPMPPVMPPR